MTTAWEAVGRLEPVVNLRPATADDAPAVARIYVESWNEGFGDLMGRRPLTDELEARWAVDLGDPKMEWTVAEVDGEVVGFVGIGPSRDPLDPTIGEIDTIAVDPVHWRRGVGRALMEHALTRLAAGYRTAVLWTVAGYERGHAFYTAMGWTPLRRSRKDDTEVAFVHPLT